MRLHATITSPYARKVWVVAHELGLEAQIERIPTNPHEDEYLREDNPLCRVPTLICDDGLVLFDSPVICEYLNTLHEGAGLFPINSADRWRALRLQALGDGILDANVSRRNETLRPAAERSDGWIARQVRAVQAGCTWLEDRIDEIDAGPVTIGQVAVGCALGYFATRFPEDDWRRGCPRLAEWQDRFERRPSMVATRYETLKATLPPHLVKEGPSRH